MPNLVAFKDATADPPAAAALVAEAGEHFDLYSGDDAMTLPLLAIGAVGLVGTSTHWTGPWFRRMVDAVERDDLPSARELQARLLPSMRFVNSDDSVFTMSIKALLAEIGQPAGPCRMPLPAAPPEVAQRAREVWADLHR
ncbi:MAG TPA: dihydrodipicolinate synthase family protein [Ramlibacter sp.]|nr:dihydrodipicolinate synthase family protein [Ramlibacter sp.]